VDSDELKLIEDYTDEQIEECIDHFKGMIDTLNSLNEATNNPIRPNTDIFRDMKVRLVAFEMFLKQRRRNEREKSQTPEFVQAVAEIRNKYPWIDQ
jgi:Asp-tRNA(Asn)/Glu-tRNA(Gln) amidotransferase C subunit